MSGTLKELRAHLVAAKTALSAGNLAAARESCKSALGVDDESYEGWTFDGKVAFASGDATGALESYKRAVGIRNDHPAAWQGIAETAEATGAHAECAAALGALLRMPVDDRSVTRDKKAEWRRRMASALGAAGAIEAIYSLLAIRDNVCPPTINLDNPSVETAINLAANSPVEKRVDAVLSNSFGFGGTNASLVMKRV